jgi:hypothetical protein
VWALSALHSHSHHWLCYLGNTRVTATQFWCARSVITSVIQSDFILQSVIAHISIIILSSLLMSFTLLYADVSNLFHLETQPHWQSLTLSPPAVKTQWLSQCQAFQRLVRSSHTLVNWTFDILNQFSTSLACFWKHWMLFASVCYKNIIGQ